MKLQPRKVAATLATVFLLLLPACGTSSPRQAQTATLSVAVSPCGAPTHPLPTPHVIVAQRGNTVAARKISFNGATTYKFKLPPGHYEVWANYWNSSTIPPASPSPSPVSTSDGYLSSPTAFGLSVTLPPGGYRDLTLVAPCTG